MVKSRRCLVEEILKVKSRHCLAEIVLGEKK